MSDPIDIPKRRPDSALDREINPGSSLLSTTTGSIDSQYDAMTPGYMSSTPSTPYLLSRNSSSYFNTKDVHSTDFDESNETPAERVTFLDLFDGLAIPTQLEKVQATINAQKQRIKRRQALIRSQSSYAKDVVTAEIRKRVPTAEEQLVKYRKRMKRSVDEVNKRWNETVTITMREKISFISAVLNIFISGYIIGAYPQYFYYWFTAQFAYFMPIRYITYHRKGYHYFLADLCYFVNALCLLSTWAFPQSKRLFISTYCLAYGNNAIAIVMWRNSLVFHSLDKVTSLFIHVMPPVMLHCLVHLTPAAIQAARFPAVYAIKYSPVDSTEHYSLMQMLAWATLPYAIWQLSYHYLITVRRREAIAAGRPTSFTWLRRSYAKTWIGKFVLSLPEVLQEPAFMLIQYGYACLTIIPCPLWFWYRWLSALFLMFVFSWSIWNGANYYMDVFGKKFQKELEQMKKEMARLQQSPGSTPLHGPVDDESNLVATGNGSIDKLPLLDEKTGNKDKEVTSASILADQTDEDPEEAGRDEQEVAKAAGVS